MEIRARDFSGQDKRSDSALEFVVVIPSLNEAEGIGRVIDDLNTALNGKNFGILVVDGNSTDRTGEIAADKGALVIKQRDTGYGDALRTGFIYVRNRLNAKCIVMIDGDYSYDPHDVPKLIAPILSDEADMVIGNRLNGLKQDSMTKTNVLGNRILSWFARKTLRLKIHDTQSGLRAFKSELVDDMDLESDGMPFAIEMLVDAHAVRARIIEIPISYRPRKGKAKLNPVKDGLMILGTILRLIRDTEPLLFFLSAAGFFAIFGIFFGSQVTLEWLQTGTVKKIPTAILAVLFLGVSMQFFTLGLVADMIKRTRSRKNRY